MILQRQGYGETAILPSLRIRHLCQPSIWCLAGKIAAVVFATRPDRGTKYKPSWRTVPALSRRSPNAAGLLLTSVGGRSRGSHIFCAVMAAGDSILRLKAALIALGHPVIAPPPCSLGSQPTQRCAYNGVYSVFKVPTYALISAARSTRQRKGVQNTLHDRLILQC